MLLKDFFLLVMLAMSEMLFRNVNFNISEIPGEGGILWLYIFSLSKRRVKLIGTSLYEIIKKNK